MHYIPINLIIGFLGAGKTTAIRHLLTQVPDGERWGVLVNEFGEVGIDGVLLEADGIAVQEVAGGCLCCVAASGLEAGLNRLIQDINPNRIIIEPSGLGHPAQIIENLMSQPFAQATDLQATIGLVDARHLSQTQYTEHTTFQDQVHLADVLIASKADLYNEKDHHAFEQFVRTLDPPKQHLATVEHGKLQTAWLNMSRSTQRRALFPEAHQFLQQQAHEHSHEHVHKQQGDWLKIENANDGYHSCGWIISKDKIFNTTRLITLLDKLSIDRVKGVVRTEKGWLAVNLTRSEREIRDIDPKSDSRLEMIHYQPVDWQVIDQELANV
ncbi:GTP-binding protein [Candidatus Albibeggiatoa sp. nov. NOAA]|uniref:CobW family GTP-binding protein n=1 Tax=Candidatus Albibeggiatoa sp. nov. NOAA TaxID=3162724 RepID=UPI0033000D11|nr:GTP-binding protein [Thiotrichaceae bacterium]